MLREDPRLTCFAETRCVIPPSDQKQEAPCQHLTCPHHPPDHHPSIVRDEEERLGAGCAAGVLHLDEEERGARHRRAGFNADDVLETCCDATARASPLASALLPSPRIAPPSSSISTRRSAGRVIVVRASPFAAGSSELVSDDNIGVFCHIQHIHRFRSCKAVCCSEACAYSCLFGDER